MSPVSFSAKRSLPSGANAMFDGNDRPVATGSNVIAALAVACRDEREREPQRERECRSPTHPSSVACTT